MKPALFISNSKLKSLLTCLLTIIVLIAVITPMTSILERKDSTIKYSEFFEEKEDIDVLFLGTSHVMNGIFPMELWKEYGITSYNFGGHSNTLATSYWVMQNALRYQTPKLIVIDCAEVEYDGIVSENSSLVHQSLDAFPFSITKFRTVNDLFKGADAQTKLEYLWDFSVYHSRWEELTSEDINPVPTPEKGAESRVDVANVTVPDRLKPDQKIDYTTIGFDYLRKIVEDCNKRNIPVLLINLPYPAKDVQQLAANRVSDIADETGTLYINFLQMDIVDYSTDMYDEDSHLNPSGARKVTSYLGNIIQNEYGIEGHRGDPAYDGWDKAYDRYHDFKVSLLKESENNEAVIRMLSEDTDFNLREEDGVLNVYDAKSGALVLCH